MQPLDSKLAELHRHGVALPPKPQREMPNSGFHALDQQEDRSHQLALDAWADEVRRLHEQLVSSRSSAQNG